MTSRTQNSGGFLLYQRLRFTPFVVSSQPMSPNVGGSKAQHVDLFFYPGSFTPLVILIFIFYNLCPFADKAQVCTLSLNLFYTSSCLLDTSTWMSIWYVTLHISKFFSPILLFTFSVNLISGNSILPVAQAKNCGIVIDSSLALIFWFKLSAKFSVSILKMHIEPDLFPPAWW